MLLDNFCKECIHSNKLMSVECLECTGNTKFVDKTPYNYTPIKEVKNEIHNRPDKR